MDSPALFAGTMWLYTRNARAIFDHMSEQIKITRLVNAGESCRIQITGHDQILTVSLTLVHQHRLKEGIVLTSPQLSQLLAEAELDQCDQSVARSLAMREHTTGELRDKLQRKGFSKDAIATTLKRYSERGLLDDAHVAAKLVRSSLEKNPSGRAYLVAVLRKKKVDRELAEQTVDMILSGKDETAMAVESLSKRWSSLRHLDLERARSRAYNYLSRRGIGYSAARAAFEQLYNREREDSDH